MADLDSITLNLKACLISMKGGIPLNNLESEYFHLVGEHISYRSLGFPSLEALLNSTGKFTVNHFGGSSVVQAKVTDKTQHLTDLIKRQKSKPPKKKPFAGSKHSFQKSNATNNFSRTNRPNSYSGSSTTSRPVKNNYQSASIPNYTNGNKKSYSSRPTHSNQYNSYQPKSNAENSYNTPLNIYGNHYSNGYNKNHQQNSNECLPETKALQQSNLTSISKNVVQSFPSSKSNGTYSMNTNGKTSSNTQPTRLLSSSSCSSIESTCSFSSTKLTPKISSDKLQTENVVNNIVPQTVNNFVKDNNSKSNYFIQENNSESVKPSIQLSSVQQSSAKNPPLTLHNMAVKPATAQSRLARYPKKCDDTNIVNTANGAGTLTPTDDALIANLRIEVGDSFSEIDDDKDYINELESYLKNLNLSEPYYELMVKKEKSGGTIKLTHICTIKVNDKSVSSSFPVECNSVDFAKQVAAKHALTVLVKQYGENVIYPITNDINTMASRIKEFLKVGFKETGLMGYVLERMYREQFQENLPDNWVQLLEVYSYFTFDKVVANKIIIYLNETENNFHNGHGSTNGHIEAPVEEENIIPGTPLMFEDYEEKSVLVSANYGSSSIWIRFVGQSADENFIQMQAKFNDTMNTTGFSIAEQVSEGEFYGVLYNSSWHRVQVASPADNDGTVTCFMVDTGEQLNISKDQICYLEPMFMKTKTQAIECVLTRLDNFGSFDGLKELLDEMILNKTFFLLPDSLEEGYARVSLYEKGKESDRINVNELIIQRLLEKSIAKLPSIEENAIVDGNVSSIIESGYLYIQLKFDIVTSIEEMLPSDDCLLPEYFLKSKGDVQKDQVYIAKYKDNDDVVWCRAQVVEFVNDTKVKIIFIDYGNNSVCEVTELVDLYMFDPLMAMIPPQAIKVSMHLVPPNIMTTEIAQKIFSIIGNDKILVNLISVPANDVPCIQLHKFKEDSPDIPLCINIQLAQSLKNNKLPTS